MLFLYMYNIYKTYLSDHETKFSDDGTLGIWGSHFVQDWDHLFIRPRSMANGVTTEDPWTHKLTGKTWEMLVLLSTKRPVFFGKRVTKIVSCRFFQVYAKCLWYSIPMPTSTSVCTVANRQFWASKLPSLISTSHVLSYKAIVTWRANHTPHLPTPATHQPSAKSMSLFQRTSSTQPFFENVSGVC